jgi:hypothetical protein
VLVLLMLVLAASWASQLLVLETLLIVMSISVSGKIESEPNIDDTFGNSCERGIKRAYSAREQLLRILTGGDHRPCHCHANFKRGASVPRAAKSCRIQPIFWRA